MPVLASYEASLRSKGFVLIGAAFQSEKDKAIEVVKNAKVEFPVTDGAEIPGWSANAFPTYGLFGRDGQLIDTQVGGAPDGFTPEFKAKIEKALAEESVVFQININGYSQTGIRALAQKANKGKDLGKLLADVQRKVNGGTAAEKDEATRLHGEIVAFGDSEFARAQNEKAAGKPHVQFDVLKQIAANYKDHELGKRADEALKKIKADKNAMRDIEAARVFGEFQQATGKSRERIFNTLKNKYADTTYAQQAKSEMDHG